MSLKEEEEEKHTGEFVIEYIFHFIDSLVSFLSPFFSFENYSSNSLSKVSVTEVLRSNSLNANEGTS